MAGAALVALTACTPATNVPEVTPEARPAGLGVSPPKVTRTPSAASRALAQKLSRQQERRLALGLLETNGGGPEAYYSDDDLMRNFVRIAFYDEHAPDGGRHLFAAKESMLRKWTRPVRVSIAFGSGVPADQRAENAEMVTRYVARLARITGHPISMSSDNPNFVVFFMSVDDGAEASTMLQSVNPNVSAATMSFVGNMPRATDCLVTAFGHAQNDYSYVKAMAVIRSEHPSLSRRSCVHEELAQGLGLANDSRRARPSIFNDDDEYAYLTTHDEELLRLLYNPALRPGMTLEEASPILRRLIAARGGPS